MGKITRVCHDAASAHYARRSKCCMLLRGNCASKFRWPESSCGACLTQRHVEFNQCEKMLPVLELLHESMKSVFLPHFTTDAEWNRKLQLLNIFKPLETLRVTECLLTVSLHEHSVCFYAIFFIQVVTEGESIPQMAVLWLRDRHGQRPQTFRGRFEISNAKRKTVSQEAKLHKAANPAVVCSVGRLGKFQFHKNGFQGLVHTHKHT